MADLDLETYDLLDLLTNLVDKSLVARDDSGTTSRYTTLETLLAYAVERLADEGIETVSARRYAHRHHYLRLAETAAPQLRRADQLAWLDRLETEHDNLRAAIETSVDDPDPTFGLRLAIALREFWYRRGHLADAAPLAPVFAKIDGLPPGHLQAAGLAIVSFLASARADYVSARTLAERAVVVSLNVHDPVTAVDALLTLALVHRRQGDYHTAAVANDRALALALDLDDQHLIAQVTPKSGDPRRRLWKRRRLPRPVPASTRPLPRSRRPHTARDRTPRRRD
jgi:hypothetical protein